MESGLSAESVYDGEEVTPQEPVTEVETEVEATEEVTEEPKGEKQEAEASEQVESPSPETTPEPATVPLSALHGERERRQALERQLQELQQAQQRPEPTSVFEDEQRFRQEVEQSVRGELVTTLLAQSRSHAVREHGSELVDQAERWFEQAAPDAPALIQRFHQSGNDYHEVVDLYQKHLKAEALNDVDAVEARLRAEIEEKVRAEIAAETSEKQKVLDSIPKSLAGDASKGGLQGSNWTGPTPAEQLYDN